MAKNFYTKCYLRLVIPMWPYQWKNGFQMKSVIIKVLGDH